MFFFVSGCLKKKLPKSWNKFPRHTRKSTESTTPAVNVFTTLNWCSFFPKEFRFRIGWPPSQQMNDPERKCLAFRQELQPCSYPYRPCIWYICLLIYRINQMWVNTPIHGMGNDWIRSILNARSSCLACKFRNFVIFSWQHVKMISQNTNSSCTSDMFY